MTRSRLPNRRQGYTFTVPHPTPGSAIIYTVKIGFDQGHPKEVFISCNKLTTAMHISGLEIATLVSIALQHGASLEELAAAMPRENNSDPQGAAGAVLDAIIKELELLNHPGSTAAA